MKITFVEVLQPMTWEVEIDSLWTDYDNAKQRADYLRSKGWKTRLYNMFADEITYTGR